MALNILDWLPSDLPGRILLSLLPLFIGGFLKLWSRRRVKTHVLRAKITTMTAIDDLSQNPRLSVRYENRPLQTLNVTTAVVWNAGQEEIRRENLAPAASPTLVLPQGTAILEASILGQTRESTKGQLGVEETALRLDFDFLNPNDAIVVHCLHTGPLAEVRLTGDLIGKSTAVSSDWEHQLGVHGQGSEGARQLVNLQALGRFSALLNLVFVSGLLAAFLFNAWWPVLLVATILFTASVLVFLPSHALPKAVRKGLDEASG